MIQNHKQITFTSRTIGKSDADGNLELSGELTMKGITKNVKLSVQSGGVIIDPWGNERAGFSVNGKINRSDWGLIWNSPLETSGLMLSEEVILSCEVELTNSGQKVLNIEEESLPANTSL